MRWRILGVALLGVCSCGKPPPVVVTPPVAAREPQEQSEAVGSALLTPLTGPFIATQISVGDGQACARSNDGRVACWGRAIANGAWMSSEAGTATPMLLGWWSDVDEVAVNGGTVCVLRGAKISCWKPSEDNPPPYELAGVSDPIRMVPFSLGICAIEKAGTVACWGYADWIDPDGTTEGAWSVPGWSNVERLWCDSDCCARDGAGTIKCLRELDDDLEHMRPSMQTAADLAIAGDELCVIDDAGKPTCGGYPSKYFDFSLDGLRVAKIAGDDRVVCVVTTAGELVCQRGEERRKMAKGVTDLEMTDGSGCALTKDGGVLCWGRGEHGQLGDGGAVERFVPGPVRGLDDVVELRVAHTSACARRRDGTVHCWGDGTSLATRVFDRVTAMSDSQYAAGCMLIDGNIRCAHADLHGERWELSRVSGQDQPSDLIALATDRGPNVCGIAASDGRVHCLFSMGDYGSTDRWVVFGEPRHATAIVSASLGWCAIHSGGKVSCFEDPRYEDDPDFLEELPRAIATQVDGIDDALQLAAGQDQYCARKKDGRVVCWGRMGFSAQHFSSNVPKEVPELRGATSIASNQFHTCGVVDGIVRCWGDNRDGQLGIGTRAPHEGFVDVELPSRAKSVGTGRDHTCALLEDGTVQCWGDSTRGQLGDGRVMRSDQAIRVVGIGG